VDVPGAVLARDGGAVGVRVAGGRVGPLEIGERLGADASAPDEGGVDAVAFDKPETYETALITCGKWTQTGPTTLKIEDGTEAIQVEIETGGQPFEVKATTINEHVHTKTLPTRLGIALKNPIAQATLTVKITPAK
jgi:hypothetical protein